MSLEPLHMLVIPNWAEGPTRNLLLGGTRHAFGGAHFIAATRVSRSREAATECSPGRKPWVFFEDA
jgi:hypothetical protein